MIICLEQTFICTTEVLLLSRSSGTIIKRQSKALYIYIYIYIFMIFDKDQVESARRIESELNISSII